jgi:hypothetical protein
MLSPTPRSSVQRRDIEAGSENHDFFASRHSAARRLVAFAQYSSNCAKQHEVAPRQRYTAPQIPSAGHAGVVGINATQFQSHVQGYPNTANQRPQQSACSNDDRDFRARAEVPFLVEGVHGL